MGMFSGIIRRSNSDQVKKQDSIEVKLANFLSMHKRREKDFYISNNKVYCKKYVYIYDDDLIDGKLPFKFGRVEWDFNCYNCSSLVSLEGSPETVGGHFNCSGCSSLVSLEGAPNSVDGDFDCNYCSSLISLEGAPNSVGDGFYCYDCYSLKSLEGAPKEVGGDFYCSNCTALKSYDTNTIIKGKLIK